MMRRAMSVPNALFRPDRPRTIDRHIDFFGSAAVQRLPRTRPLHADGDAWKTLFGTMRAGIRSRVLSALRGSGHA